MEQTLIQRAEHLARHAHSGQFRKDGKTPYIGHPFAVRDILKAEGYSEDIQIVGVLHDVVEDGRPDMRWMDMIADEFGAITLSEVMWLTDTTPKEAGKRALRKLISRDRLTKAPRTAQIVKLADRLDNLRTFEGTKNFLQVYLGETRLLLDAIGQASPALSAKIMDQMSKMEPEL